ncbi:MULTISPECIES: DUF397 domain-containing protein [unclassified Streptomyces]|uniref:DUF397 domain-containing protein n=1 Tax=unclassified Streptomyces TaxID=2593676 RepID=UPI000DD9BD19|nr:MULTISPECIES: DUF397 domain-containing protein [unclassified Streptomyces]QZZ27914.1 DUF397 domain-containing protein [Streptomyces sp. ST1015]
MRGTPDLSTAQWRKSSYSGGQDGSDNCVEVAHNIPNLIPVRDSKSPHATPLTFTFLAWQVFVAVTKTAPTA